VGGRLGQRWSSSSGGGRRGCHQAAPAHPPAKLGRRLVRVAPVLACAILRHDREPLQPRCGLDDEVVLAGWGGGGAEGVGSGWGQTGMGCPHTLDRTLDRSQPDRSPPAGPQPTPCRRAAQLRPPCSGDRLAARPRPPATDRTPGRAAAAGSPGSAAAASVMAAAAAAAAPRPRAPAPPRPAWRGTPSPAAASRGGGGEVGGSRG
jgi:hypothetical protein